MALTIVNAELDNGNVAAQDLTQLIEEIMTIVKYSLEISLDDEDIYVQRFITHLKFLRTCFNGHRTSGVRRQRYV